MPLWAHIRQENAPPCPECARIFYLTLKYRVVRKAIITPPSIERGDFMGANDRT